MLRADRLEIQSTCSGIFDIYKHCLGFIISGFCPDSSKITHRIFLTFYRSYCFIGQLLLCIFHIIRVLCILWRFCLLNILCFICSFLCAVRLKLRLGINLHFLCLFRILCIIFLCLRRRLCLILLSQNCPFCTVILCLLDIFRLRILFRAFQLGFCILSLLISSSLGFLLSSCHLQSLSLEFTGKS